MVLRRRRYGRGGGRGWRGRGMSSVAHAGPDRRRSLGGKNATAAATPARRRRSRKQGVPAEDKPLLRVSCVASAVRAGTRSRTAVAPRAGGCGLAGAACTGCAPVAARRQKPGAQRTAGGPAPPAPRAHRTLPPTAASGWELGGTPLPTRRGWLRAHPLPVDAFDGGRAAGAPCGTVRPAGTRRLDLSAEASQEFLLFYVEQAEDEYGAGQADSTTSADHRGSVLASHGSRAGPRSPSVHQENSPHRVAWPGQVPGGAWLEKGRRRARRLARPPAPYLAGFARAGGEEEPDAVAAGPLPPLPLPTLARL